MICSRDEEKFESPSWHESILNERKEALSGGMHKHYDWTEAKERIKRNVSCKLRILDSAEKDVEVATISFNQTVVVHACQRNQGGIKAYIEELTSETLYWRKHDTAYTS